MKRVLLVFFLSLPAVLEGATFIVDPAGAGDFLSIQAALDWARNGDTVLVRPGEYFITEPINFNRLRLPEDPAAPPVKDLALRSEGGPAVTTIRMSGAPAHPDRASVAVFVSGEGRASVVEGFLLTGGK